MEYLHMQHMQHVAWSLSRLQHGVLAHATCYMHVAWSSNMEYLHMQHMQHVTCMLHGLYLVCNMEYLHMNTHSAWRLHHHLHSLEFEVVYGCFGQWWQGGTVL